MSPTPSTNTSEYHLLTGINTSRKLLLHHTPLYRPQPPTSLTNQTLTVAANSSMDDNLVMILALLLCALICALGMNSALRCAIRCSDRRTRNAEPILPSPRPVVRVLLAQSGLGRSFMQALPNLTYHHGLKLTGSVAECAICLSDFVPGQQVRALPACNHGFHVRCIDEWLMAHSSCPTCRQCLSVKSEKNSNCNGNNSPTSSSEYVPSAVLVPLPREGLVVSFRA